MGTVSEGTSEILCLFEKQKLSGLSSCLSPKEDQWGKEFENDVKLNSYPKSTVVKLSHSEGPCAKNKL